MRLGTLVFPCALPKGMACPLRKCRSTAIGCSFPGRTATQSAVMECYYQLLRRYRDSICMVGDIVWKESLGWSWHFVSYQRQWLSVNKLGVTESKFSDILWLWFLNRIRWKFLHWDLLVLQEKAGEWNVAHHLLQQMKITGFRHKGGTWPDQFSMAAYGGFFWVPWFMIDKCIYMIFNVLWRYKTWAFKFGDVPKAVYWWYLPACHWRPAPRWLASVGVAGPMRWLSAAASALALRGEERCNCWSACARRTRHWNLLKMGMGQTLKSHADRSVWCLDLSRIFHPNSVWILTHSTTDHRGCFAWMTFASMRSWMPLHQVHWDVRQFGMEAGGMSMDVSCLIQMHIDALMH